MTDVTHWDSPQGRTHFVGDGCRPPHAPLPEQPLAIKPRELPTNPRCPECQTGGMFHPAHKWAPCQVQLPAEDPCGCTAGVVSPSEERS